MLSNELRKGGGILVSSGWVYSIWFRHNLATFKEHLHSLEEKSARKGIFYTEAQICNVVSLNSYLHTRCMVTVKLSPTADF